MALFSFIRRYVPGPGAEAYQFVSGISNPQFPLYKGPGVAVPTFWRSVSPQLYYPQQMIASAGIGGVQAGYMYGAPLYIPPGSGINS